MNRRDRRAQQSWARKDPRLQGMEIRYGGRTLVFHVLVNTDEDAEQVVWRLRRAAPGPKQVMTLVAGRKPDTSHWASTWEGAGIPTLFDGRTIAMEVYLNTDEEPEPISARLLAAARVPGNAATAAALRSLGNVPSSEDVSLAVLIAGGDVDAEAARSVWEATFRASVKTVEHEN